MRPEIMDGINRHIQEISGMERAKILEISPGHSKISVDILPDSLNLYGNAHGGFLFSICDMASGMSTYAYEIFNVTQSSNIQFIRGVSEGTVLVESNSVHKGKKTVVNQVTITDEDGKLLATATFTMFLFGPI